MSDMDDNAALIAELQRLADAPKRSGIYRPQCRQAAAALTILVQERDDAIENYAQLLDVATTFRAEKQAEEAKVASLQVERDKWEGYYNQAAISCTKAEAKVAELTEALREARNAAVDDWLAKKTERNAALEEAATVVGAAMYAVNDTSKYNSLLVVANAIRALKEC